MQNILITGASSGLGLFLAKHFDKLNFNLVTVGRDKRKVNNLKNLLSLKNKSNCFRYDLSVSKDFKNFINKIKSKKFNSVIHCMGGGLGMHETLIDKKNLSVLFDINVGIALNINNEVISKNLKKKNLKLIHIGSVKGLETGASVGYSMVKASLIAYTKTLARKLIKKNIFIHCVLPGAFEYNHNSFERLKKKNKKIYNKFIKEKLPLQKISKPNDFIGLFELLISDKGNILSGSSITADFTETSTFRI
tara:strand:- start:518 stop:1264 length:747 start_codon:yes stop_codon:yes gene_type:complete